MPQDESKAVQQMLTMGGESITPEERASILKAFLAEAREPATKGGSMQLPYRWNQILSGLPKEILDRLEFYRDQLNPTFPALAQGIGTVYGGRPGVLGESRPSIFGNSTPINPNLDPRSLYSLLMHEGYHGMRRDKGEPWSEKEAWTVEKPFNMDILLR